jgi:hypothetical protein
VILKQTKKVQRRSAMAYHLNRKVFEEKQLKVELIGIYLTSDLF